MNKNVRVLSPHTPNRPAYAKATSGKLNIRAQGSTRSIDHNMLACAPQERPWGATRELFMRFEKHLSVFKIFPLVLIFGLLFGNASNLNANENSLIHSVQLRYETLHTLRARFKQISLRSNIMGNLEEYVQEGELLVKKPGKLRWDYRKPEKALYLSDGKTLWIYKPNENQVQVSAWDPDSLALQFLLGTGKFSQNFDIRELTAKEKKDFSASKGNWLHLEPKQTKKESVGPVASMIMRIHEKTKIIEEVLVIDPIGAQTRWIFDQIKIDPKLDEARFIFKVPKGAQIVQQ